MNIWKPCIISIRTVAWRINNELLSRYTLCCYSITTFIKKIIFITSSAISTFLCKSLSSACFALLSVNNSFLWVDNSSFSFCSASSSFLLISSLRMSWSSRDVVFKSNRCDQFMRKLSLRFDWNMKRIIGTEIQRYNVLIYNQVLLTNNTNKTTNVFQTMWRIFRLILQI